MTWWNLGGLNPNFKEFADTHPDKTLMGMMWSMQWRLAILVVLIEATFFLIVIALAFLFSLGHH